MKRIIIILWVTIFAVIINSSCNNGNSQTKENVTNENLNVTSEQKSQESIISKLKGKKVITYSEWDVGEDLPLEYVVRDDNDKSIFSISNTSGKVLYERKAIEIQRVFQVWALRTANPQLAFEYTEGGNDTFIELLDYEDGKIQELIDSTGSRNSFNADIQIQPQFRSGVNPAKEPFEILLTDGGLAGPMNKNTKVFRFKDGKYQYYGKYSQQNIHDYKETLISR